LPTSTNEEVIFKVTDDFIRDNHLEWGQYVGTSTDGARAMTSAKEEVAVYIQAIAPEAKPTHCCINSESLTTWDTPTGLKQMPDDTFKIAHFFERQATECHLASCITLQ
jgi:hypothetical protein